jgi:outer membrane protein assembly factor BamE (lipoprotein component of BamABCDE complex)
MRITKFFLHLIVLLSLVLFLLGWRDVTGNTINPNYVQRIKDGQTTKNEITLLFGEPQEIKRTENCVVFIYKSFKDAPAGLPYNPDQRLPKPQSEQLFLVDDNKQLKKPETKTEGKILKSTLTIYFKPDGQTVSGHEYTEDK